MVHKTFRWTLNRFVIFTGNDLCMMMDGFQALRQLGHQIDEISRYISLSFICHIAGQIL